MRLWEHVWLVARLGSAAMPGCARRHRSLRGAGLAIGILLALPGLAGAQSYTITTNANPGGLLAPIGPVIVPAGASRTFFITPNAYAGIQDVRVDGVSVGKVTAHTFANVSADHTIAATFVTDTAQALRGWISDGAPVATGAGTQKGVVATTDGGGGQILAWEDSTSADIVVQRVSSAGVLRWGEGGVTITGAGDQRAPLVCPDGAGGAIVAWTEGSGSGQDVRAQRVDADGSVLWDPAGVAVCTATGVQDPDDLLADGAGGAFVVWEDRRNGGVDVFAQRVDASGTTLWNLDGVEVCVASGDQQGPRLVADATGGAIAVWDDARVASWFLYAQRLGSDGAVRWAPGGVLVSDEARDTRLTRRIVSDARGGVIVAWTPGVTDHDAYVQRVDSIGVQRWASPGVALSALGSAEENCVIAEDGTGGAIVAWADRRNDAGDIYAQRVSADGIPLWSGGSVQVCGAAQRQDHLAIAHAGAGEAVLAWADGRNGGSANDDVFAQKLSALGVPQWTADGVALSTAVGPQVLGVNGDADIGGIVPAGAGGWLVSWVDRRSDAGDIYTQRIGPSGVDGFDHAIMPVTGPPLAGDILPRGGMDGVGVFTGSSQPFSIVPEAGNLIQDVAVDAASLGSVSAYTFYTLDAGHTISVFFSTAPSILQSEPAEGADVGPLTVAIFGAGLQAGATVKLARSGQPDIAGTQVSVASDGRSVTATFDLAGGAQGAWDVVVTNPDLSGATLPGGFTIQSGAPAQVRVDVLGPGTMRPNRRQAFDIVLENLGNTDVEVVPLWIAGIPADAAVELDFSLTAPPQEGIEPLWTGVPLALDGPAGKYLALVIPRLPPGATVRRIYLTVPNTVADFELNAALTPPWLDNNGFRSCMSGILTATACMGGQLAAIKDYLSATPDVQALSGIGLWAKVAWRCEGAATLAAALATAEQALDFMLQPVEGTAVPAGCEQALVPRWQSRRPVTVVTSVDPNDKLGPSGAGANRLIGSEQLLPYSIRFENLETATAPAQEVLVIDALDAATLDVNTLSLGPITFGTHTIHPPAGLTSYTTEVDLRPAEDVVVRVGVNLDRATGIIGWSLRSIDPATGTVPEDPQAGFLPPNVTPPEGEGSVLFTVMPLAGLGNGTAIRNRATIDFDGDARLTPEWVNELDTTPPKSAVLPLGATQDSASFTVHWEAEGAPADLRDFSVYVSEDGGDYRPWRVHVTVTADTIEAPGGRTYAFYSLARDSSGNLEPVPVAPDVETFSRVAVGEGAQLRLALEGAVPNPALGAARVWFTLPSAERAVLEVLDVAGRRVFRREVGALGPGRHAVGVSAAARRPGLYFLRLAQGGQTLRARMIALR